MSVLSGAMISMGRKLGSSQVTTHHHKTQQNTDRIARTARKVLISRYFLRAVLSRGIDRQWTVTVRHDKYRPRIDCLEMSRFAGLSSSTPSPRSVRSIR